ncbi:MAG TPA: hypothetical protein VJX91_04720 [Candidatus Eisenbacteria bacterium]|nr:hypothetical protein [Candidatus Eisenbacteria bacterium]
MDRVEVILEWSEGSWSHEVVLTSLGENRFRLEESIFGLEFEDISREERKRRPRVKDVIEAQMLEPGRLRFIRVIERARMKAKSWIIGDAIIDSPHFEHALQKVMDLGGAWERVFGGYLTVYLPRDSDYDLWTDLQRMEEEGKKAQGESS